MFKNEIAKLSSDMPGIPKHLLMIAPQHSLHVDTRVIDMTNCFCEAGTKVTIVCPPQHTDNRKELESLLHKSATVYVALKQGFADGEQFDLTQYLDQPIVSASQRLYAKWLQLGRSGAHSKKFNKSLASKPWGLRHIAQSIVNMAMKDFEKRIEETLTSGQNKRYYWNTYLSQQLPASLYEKYREIIWLDSYNYHCFINALVINKTIAPIDCIYSNDLWSLPTGCLVKELLGVPLIYDTHEIGTTLLDEPYYQKNAERNEKWMYQLCDVFMTVNQSCGQYYSDRFPFLKPIIISNAHRFTWQRPADIVPLKQRLSVPKDAPLAVYVGSLHNLTHLDRFIRALRRSRSNLHLAILGKGGDIERFKQMSEDLDLLGERVFFLGHVNYREVVPTIYGADFGIIPNIQTYPNLGFNSSSKMFDYIQAELPFISDLGPEMQKVVDEYKTGQTVDFQQEPAQIASLLDAFWAKIQAGEFDQAKLQRAKTSLVWPRNVVDLICPKSLIEEATPHPNRLSAPIPV